MHPSAGRRDPGWGSCAPEPPSPSEKGAAAGLAWRWRERAAAIPPAQSSTQSAPLPTTSPSAGPLIDYRLRHCGAAISLFDALRLHLGESAAEAGRIAGEECRSLAARIPRLIDCAAMTRQVELRHQPAEVALLPRVVEEGRVSHIVILAGRAGLLAARQQLFQQHRVVGEQQLPAVHRGVQRYGA